MKEYVFRDMKCLVDSKTGLPVRVYIAKDEIEKYDEISRRAYESGMRFRMGLEHAEFYEVAL